MAKESRLREPLLAYRKDLMHSRFWPYLSELEGRPASKKAANKFFMSCVVDYQQPFEQAWKNTAKLVEETWGDPADLWGHISSFSEHDWMAKRRAFALHRYAGAHRRVWRIANVLSSEHAGDARALWKGLDVSAARKRLHAIRTGEQITEMVLGALADTGQISGSVEVKADTHVRRVVGRLVTGKRATEKEARELTRMINPEDPWALDRPLFALGTGVNCGTVHEGCCRARGKPLCDKCIPELRKVCAFYRSNK